MQATITIEVLNDKPVANDDSYAAFSGVKLVVPAAEGVLVNDTDSDGAVLWAKLESAGGCTVDTENGHDVAAEPPQR